MSMTAATTPPSIASGIFQRLGFTSSGTIFSPSKTQV